MYIEPIFKITQIYRTITAGINTMGSVELEIARQLYNETLVDLNKTTIAYSSVRNSYFRNNCRATGLGMASY